MKKLNALLIVLFSIAVFTLAVGSVSAEADTGTETTTAHKIKVCTRVSEGAMDLMKLRQANVPLLKVMEIVMDDDLSIRMTTDAYSRPLYTTEEYQKKLIISFGSEWFAECFRVLS